MDDPKKPNATPTPAPALEPRTIELSRLPKSIEGLISWLAELPEQDARNVRASVFHSPLTRDFAETARFVDSVLLNSKRAEDWVGKDRVTGAERDQYRERVESALRIAVRETVALARRARLTEILQRNRILVQRYGSAAEVGAKTARPAAEAETEAA